MTHILLSLMFCFSTVQIFSEDSALPQVPPLNPPVLQRIENWMQKKVTYSADQVARDGFFDNELQVVMNHSALAECDASDSSFDLEHVVIYAQGLAALGHQKIDGIAQQVVENYDQVLQADGFFGDELEVAMNKTLAQQFASSDDGVDLSACVARLAQRLNEFGDCDLHASDAFTSPSMVRSGVDVVSNLVQQCASSVNQELSLCSNFENNAPDLGIISGVQQVVPAVASKLQNTIINFPAIIPATIKEDGFFDDALAVSMYRNRIQENDASWNNKHIGVAIGVTALVAYAYYNGYFHACARYIKNKCSKN